MRAAVIGHVEWVTFLRVDRPVMPGAIVSASTPWEEPAGGGAVAAVELARLAGSCTLYTALGNDPNGQWVAPLLEAHRVLIRAAVRSEAQRQAITMVDPNGERTIVVLGQAQAPRLADALNFEPCDVVYFCKGDVGLLRAARRAKVLVATARVLPLLAEAGVQLDVLVHSANDPSERYAPGDLDPAPLLVASTDGANGGHYTTADGRTGRWASEPLPGPLQDAYGAGDCFAAALGFAVAEGRPAEAALAFAATRGAAALSRAGAHGGAERKR